MSLSALVTAGLRVVTDSVSVRAVITRVLEAAVHVDGELVAELPRPGLLVLLGVGHDDDAEQSRALAAKIWGLRILDGERSASDEGAPVLVVSQFTLFASTRKGRRPSWSAAAPAAVSEPLVNQFCDDLRALGAEVHTGRFGADMQVSSTNDGPVTIWIDTHHWD